MLTPRVTVMLPVHNGMPYLRHAVESLQMQTLRHFEVLVFNDGSGDETAAYLDSIGDSRFTIIHQDNVGLAATLNRMIPLVKTEYVARMDADDISLPQRLESQIKFLDEYPDVAAVGTRGGYIMGKRRMASIGIKSKKIILSYAPPTATPPYWDPLNDQGILIHSTVMMRTKILNDLGGYPIMVPGQDLALWHCMALAGHRLANMNELLLLSRIARSGISSSNLTKQYHAWCYTAYHSKCIRQSLTPMPLEQYTQQHPLSKEQLATLRSKAALRNSLADLLAGKLVSGLMSFLWVAFRNPSLILYKIRSRI